MRVPVGKTPNQPRLRVSKPETLLLTPASRHRTRNGDRRLSSKPWLRRSELERSAPDELEVTIEDRTRRRLRPGSAVDHHVPRKPHLPRRAQVRDASDGRAEPGTEHRSNRLRGTLIVVPKHGDQCGP